MSRPVLCALCGYEFDADALACHSSCPLASHCAILCCPNCGYQVVDESKARVASWARRAWHRLFHRSPPGRAVTLLQDLRPGETATVDRLVSKDPQRLWKLSSYGLVPGSTIRLQQSSPAFVVWVGETLVSLDEDVAREIFLSRN
jgi:Fe2+ transport system protein FeoA